MIVAPSTKESTNSIDQRSTQMLRLYSIRLGFLFLLFLYFILSPLFHKSFLFLDIETKAYSFFVFALLFHVNALLAKPIHLKKWMIITFATDGLLFAGLTTLWTSNQSLILFIAMIQIILCGLLFQRTGAILLAAWTSILYSVSLYSTPPSVDFSFYFSLIINNVSFFVVAYLAGHLSEQLNLMGEELTQKKEALSSLRDLQKFIIGHMTEGLVTVDLNGDIIEINTAAKKILGIDLDLVKPELQTCFREAFQWLGALKHTGQDIGAHKIDIEKEDQEGDSQTISLQYTPLSLAAENNRRVGSLLTFQDVTNERRLEESIRQSEKLAAVGQLAAGIAHEIRNPLASISGSVQLLETMIGDKADEKQLMKITIREIDRLNNMITEFLDFVRPDKIETKIINLNTLMQEILDMSKVNAKLRQDTQIDVQFLSDGMVRGDSNKLKQALLNIVINAYQAMESTESPHLTVSTKDDGELVILRVSDAGCGMDPKTMKRIFEPFLTTKPKGTGLGLAVTHKILEGHKARVLVESEIGKGTSFVLQFPKVMNAMQNLEIENQVN